MHSYPLPQSMRTSVFVKDCDRCGLPKTNVYKHESDKECEEAIKAAIMSLLQHRHNMYTYRLREKTT